ncbi:jg11083 [Pararge aegeria aegeria]|uniref:Jg11083 protein n=1 Tax=Pararge aegeria aegeria TaxID=348720 RepID=A0A8S4R9H2_9NEOP|nr:jg11083 [Pararge aegeria aegeria]
MRRAPWLDDIGGKVGDVDPRVPPAKTQTSARFDVNLTDGDLLDSSWFSPNAPVTVVKVPRPDDVRNQGPCLSR